MISIRFTRDFALDEYPDLQADPFATHREFAPLIRRLAGRVAFELGDRCGPGWSLHSVALRAGERGFLTNTVTGDILIVDCDNGLNLRATILHGNASRDLFYSAVPGAPAVR